jgi:pimeloyl-ACP methyl ester carboxylesterase
LGSISDAVARCRAAQGDDAEFGLVAHSIGGWIARAWLGGDEGDRDGCKSLVMLGTPNQPPPEGSVWEQLDQSRGLLDNVNRRFPGSYREGVKYACVVSERVRGGLGGSIEGLLAFASYLPLGGKGDARGDGITPAEGGKMDGCDCVVLEDAGHFDFLPNPLGIRVPLANATWYGSERHLDQWIGGV